MVHGRFSARRDQSPWPDRHDPKRRPCRWIASRSSGGTASAESSPASTRCSSQASTPSRSALADRSMPSSPLAVVATAATFGCRNPRALNRRASRSTAASTWPDVSRTIGSSDSLRPVLTRRRAHGRGFRWARAGRSRAHGDPRPRRCSGRGRRRDPGVPGGVPLSEVSGGCAGRPCEAWPA